MVGRVRMKAQSRSSAKGCQSQSKRVALTLESSLQSADLAESVLREFAGEAGYGEPQQEQIGIAVRESVVNAVLHGNRCDTNKKVALTAELHEF